MIHLEFTSVIGFFRQSGEHWLLLLLFNALDMKFRELKLRRDPACPICGDHPTIKELIDYDPFCGIQPAPAEPVGSPDEVTVQDMKKALDNGTSD